MTTATTGTWVDGWAAPQPTREQAAVQARDMASRGLATRTLSRELRPGVAMYVAQWLDDRAVGRGPAAGCQHPGLTDDMVRAYHNATTPWQAANPLVCQAQCVHLTGGSHQCGTWYTVESRDGGSILLVDEPAGAGL